MVMICASSSTTSPSIPLSPPPSQTALSASSSSRRQTSSRNHVNSAALLVLPPTLYGAAWPLIKSYLVLVTTPHSLYPWCHPKPRERERLQTGLGLSNVSGLIFFVQVEVPLSDQFDDVIECLLERNEGL